MAFGGGNVLRHKLYPTEIYEKNSFLETLGLFIKGAVRGPGIVSSVDSSNLKLVDYGSQVYNAQCSECHGAKLEGQPNWKIRKPDGLLPAPPHDASGHTWHHGDILLFNYTKHGGQAQMPVGVKSGMPAFGDLLHDRDIWAVLSYIKSTWPSDIQSRQSEGNKNNIKP